MVKYYNVLDGNPEYTFFNNHNVPVYFFMSVVVSLFFGLTMSAEEIFRDRKILKRERFLHLSRSSYLVSKVSIMFFFSAIQTFLYMIVGNFILEIPLTEMRYWMIIFSCSCFANMLGLNISAAFDSAVTIYILIPLLVIPQLLLSGVVINFDKFNPTVGKPVGIPLAGNVMASRWAYEAFMVTQFKDNPYEKQFYDLDREIAEAEYKRIYYIPVLESRLANCMNNRAGWRTTRGNSVQKQLSLLQNEIRYELREVGEENFPEVDKLVIGRFDSTVYVKTKRFLTTLKQAYAIRNERNLQEKEQLMDSLTSTKELHAAFESSRLKYANKAVSDVVRNVAAPERIIEYDGNLIQKIYPIYMKETRPSHLFDYSANLFQPAKYFAGRYFDTLYFNIAVIWSMTVFLFITLYFDVLKMIIRLLAGNRKHRKKDKI
jgi:hypothetical protein